MTDIFNQGYASKSTAIRGAKRAGIENAVFANRDGKWYIEPTDKVVEQNDPTPNEELVDATVDGANVGPNRTHDAATEALIEKTHQESRESIARLAGMFEARKESTPEEIEQHRAERREKHNIPAPVKPEKTPSYKEMARSGPEKSTIEKPVQFIHDYLAEHFGKESRKEIIAHLVGHGINVSTCRTQYQAFKKKKEAGNA